MRGTRDQVFFLGGPRIKLSQRILLYREAWLPHKLVMSVVPFTLPLSIFAVLAPNWICIQELATNSNWVEQ